MKDALELTIDHTSPSSSLEYTAPEAGRQTSYSPRLMTSGILNSQRWYLESANRKAIRKQKTQNKLHSINLGH